MFAHDGWMGTVTPGTVAAVAAIRSKFARVCRTTSSIHFGFERSAERAATWERMLTPRSLVLYRAIAFTRSGGAENPPMRSPARPQFFETDQTVTVSSGANSAASVGSWEKS